ncbi:unnamed protein product, partial [Thelazia callipaeda]|uniref:Kinesin motor domain-containing protein n=1 Tax=Thelazia callipaeda TaxID=103827 RepID=A0A0N5CYH2_THECL
IYIQSIYRESPTKVCWKVIDDCTIVGGDEKSYTFDQVYCDVDATKNVFDKSAKDVVESAMAGYNGTIFAYGQTSSGKTYTIFGSDDSEGIVQMTLNTIFAKILQGSGKRYMLRLSCIEIYNEKVRDLLSDTAVDLPIKEFKEKVVIDGLREEVIVDREGVEMLIQRAFANRVVGETAFNERSSRSHVILRFVIECYDDYVSAETSSYISFLNVVDLAGSESAKNFGGDGDRLKESGKINTSLLALQKVINQLSEKGQCHVNFRDSKLTRLLKSSLGGNARTLIICTISPTEIGQTLQTLRFAVRAKTIKNKPKKNLTAEGMLTRYIQTIERLKAELEENRKNGSVELELINKNIELSKEVDLLKKCILSSQMLTQTTQECMNKRARRQTWGGNWMQSNTDLLTSETLESKIFLGKVNPLIFYFSVKGVERKKISPIGEELSELPEVENDFNASVVAFTTLNVSLNTFVDYFYFGYFAPVMTYFRGNDIFSSNDDLHKDYFQLNDNDEIEADFQVSNRGSNELSRASSTMIKAVVTEDEIPSPEAHNVTSEKLSVENIEGHRKSLDSNNEDHENSQSETINELTKKVTSLTNENAHLKTANENLKEELRSRKRDIVWLEKHCDDADRVETELKEQIYELQKNRSENVESLIENLKNKVTEMKTSMLATFENKKKQYGKNLYRLENELQKKEKEICELRSSIISKDRKIGELVVELRRLTSDKKNSVRKARFEAPISGQNSNESTETSFSNRYMVKIDPSKPTPVKGYPDCRTQ